MQSVLALTDDVRAVQQKLLLDMLQRNAASNFGQLHGFENIRSIDDYKSVPLTTYDTLEQNNPGWWNDPANFTVERLVARFLTSGSTAAPKRVPVTSTLVRQKAAAFSLFWDSIYAHHPALESGNFIANFADSGVSSRDDSNVLQTSETTFWNKRMQGFQDQDRWPLGKELALIESSAERYYVATRLALQGNLHCMMSLNPSTLLKFCETLETSSADLAGGLLAGTWGRSGLAGRVAPALDGKLAENADAAARLRATVASGRPQLREIWPDLELIICWQSEIVAPYLVMLRSFADGVAFRDYITQSSECMMAVPLRDNEPGGLLAFMSHYFEFIPEEQAGAETPDVFNAWELETGRHYEPVVTTGGGLYRYRTGDCVRVVRFIGETPEISFQYRLGKTSSMTGEKLTEAQVLAALESANAVSGTLMPHVLVFPRTGDQPHYGVLLPENPGKTPTPSEKLARWLACFEQALGNANGEYQDKRASLRLGAPRLLRVSMDAYGLIEDKLRARHIGDDQFKPGVLRRERDLEKDVEVAEEIHADC